MTSIVLIIVLFVIFMGMIVFFNFAPQIGATAEGHRLERMKNASNYKMGKFLNPLPTKMDMKSGKMINVMWEFFKNDSSREPAETIQVYTFDPEEFKNLPSDEVFWIWFGHSTLLIKIDGKTLLTDPVFSERASMFSFMGPKRFNYSTTMHPDLLPEIDAVLISHDHYDHLDYKTILQLKETGTHFYVPLSVGAHLEKWGIPPQKITELNWWESVKFKEIELVFTPSRHFSGRGLLNRFSTLWGSWVISGKDRKLFYGGDSGYYPGFKEIGEKYGPFDLTFLECGAYNENWSQIHMMPEETVQASIDLNGRYLMPIHWGKFNLALHPWKEPVQRAIDEAVKLDVSIVTPEIGEIMYLNETITTQHWWDTYN